ncbi:hypothetical protein RN001_014371 [Aquatica leii]|uniref:Protein stum n=1 Tax=Aquatica leii TaxID=1421715 RepID=A0AAN7SBD8_9COLE|nr:hypothetical protein RN001_014371 [Aquatica leii]
MIYGSVFSFRFFSFLVRAGKFFQCGGVCVWLRYLAPGAFTILPPEAQDVPPDSPPVINNYRLTPTARRHRNAAFSIIAETNSNPGSRSPSPTGRVSPFRGRGFNPIGSRHASPIPSPTPPEDRRHTPYNSKRSKIPTLSRRGSNAELSDEQSPQHQTKPNLTKQFSKSLTNVSQRKVTRKPPQSPARIGKYAKPPHPPKLSPIVGSSPERTPDSGRPKIRSSPSKIPRSRSQPPSRSSAPTSRTNSKNSSRDASPSKTNTKDKYKNVKAKVNSFSMPKPKPKPKVPPKPQVPMPKLEHKDSNDSGKVATSTDNNSSNRNNSGNSKKTQNVRSNSDENKIEVLEIENDALVDVVTKPAELHKTDSSLKIIDASTVVSSTTTTATKPLKIETNFELDVRDGDSMHLPDVRTLSATSVSTAMNRMNDTVLDTRTLMKGVVPVVAPNGPDAEALSPISDKSESDHPFGSEVKPNVDRTSPTLDTLKDVGTKPEESGVTTVTNGRTKLLTTHDSVVGINVLSKSANDRIKEARTLVATDVQPIRITVKEKPLNVDVQSANVRLSLSATNGIGERPGLPPPQSPHEDVSTTTDPPKGICGRIFGRCKKPRSEKANVEKKKRTWCFAKKNVEENVQEKPEARSAQTTENDKVRWWHRLQCCKRKKIGDVETADASRRKDSWGTRTDSHLSETPKLSTRDKCKNFLRTIFCLNLCAKRRKRKEQAEAMKRRASIMSKKKSLTPGVTTIEEPTSKLDAGLVEHTSVMKAAIPVLPVPLAWFCLILNVFLPGVGTILSGFICLCMGKPRFSQKDGPKPRIGACIIDFFIGCGQMFTVLFCLVGWGWSIWWGVIMLKIARKYRKIRRAEKAMEEDARNAPSMNHTDVERGS